jgi:four helix bundle protein
MRTRSQLTVIDDALEAISLLRPLVDAIKAHDKSLAEQIRRAASSVVLNLGEAAYSDAGNRRARLYTASGSANEARIGLRTAVAWGYIEWRDASGVDDKLDAVLAKTYRWLNPKRS